MTDCGHGYLMVGGGVRQGDKVIAPPPTRAHGREIIRKMYPHERSQNGVLNFPHHRRSWSYFVQTDLFLKLHIGKPNTTTPSPPQKKLE